MQAIISYISNLDSTIIYRVQAIGPKWEPVAWFLSNGLGYPVMFAAFFLVLLILRRHRIALELAIICFISFAVIFALKYSFHAPRPYMIDQAVLAYDTDQDPGLPSAHAAMSVVILGWIALRHPKSHIIRYGSVAVIFLIGLSRVYLGVHYPSQVVVGWLVGVLLLFFFCYVTERLWSPFKKNLGKSK